MNNLDIKILVGYRVYASTSCNEIRKHCFVLYSFASGTSCSCQLISTKTLKVVLFSKKFPVKSNWLLICLQ